MNIFAIFAEFKNCFLMEDRHFGLRVIHFKFFECENKKLIKNILHLHELNIRCA